MLAKQADRPVWSFPLLGDKDVALQLAKIAPGLAFGSTLAGLKLEDFSKLSAADGATLLRALILPAKTGRHEAPTLRSLKIDVQNEHLAFLADGLGRAGGLSLSLASLDLRGVALQMEHLERLATAFTDNAEFQPSFLAWSRGGGSGDFELDCSVDSGDLQRVAGAMATKGDPVDARLVGIALRGFGWAAHGQAFSITIEGVEHEP